MTSKEALFHIDPPSVADTGDEASIQTRFRARMRMLAPGVMLVATPNAGRRTAWEARQRKNEGMKAGWPDLAAYWANGFDRASVPGCAFLEFKGRAGSLSEAQRASLDWLARAGFPCGVFRSVDTAVEFLRRAGAPFVFEREAA